MNTHTSPFLSVAASLLCCIPMMAQSVNDILPYIQQHQKIAVQQAQNTGIPASILLSQAILESNAGKNHLVLRGNNHFALKCGNDWLGETHEVIADEYDSNGDLMTSCFRNYRSDEESYKDFSTFLSSPIRANRFGFLFQLPSKDYQAWAYGIEQALHPQQKGYSTQLVHLIEDYKLNRFDNLSQEDMWAEEAFAKTGFLHHNRVKMIYAESNQTLEQIAGKYNIKLNKLLQYNDLEAVSTGLPLETGTPVYLQAKKAAVYDKAVAYHQVKAGDNMYKIAQMYGVRLKDLYKRNGFAMGAQPIVGERIMLRKVDETVPQAAQSGGETTAEKALKNSSGMNSDGFAEQRFAVFNRAEVEKSNPSGELPVIVPQSYNMTASAPPSPVHYAAPAQDVDLNHRMIEPSNDISVPMMPENEVNTHHFIYSEPILSRKLTPIKPVKPSAPAATKIVEQRSTTYVPIKQQSKGETKPYYVPQTIQKQVSGYHFVRTGETLFGISQKYGTDVDTLKRLNRITDNVILEGQKLRVK
jgi:LysM repeat protein